MIDYFTDDHFFKTAHPDQLWVYDKLILSKKLGYECGPAGIEVSESGYYIVRPVMNVPGLGLGASIEWIHRETDHLPGGSFWCEIFDGPHYSIDYHYGVQVLAVEGIHGETISKWSAWHQIDHRIPFPEILDDFIDQPWVNCEFIGDKLIEAHMRRNPDFKDYSITQYIPRFKGESIDPPDGFQYIKDPDLHGRVGAWIKKS